MAINTRGFQVSAMPQYTPVDASLAAYNPQEVTQGLLQALNAVETDRQMRAQRAARAERDLLAGKRIAATEAEYDSVISRLPVEDQAAIAASNARIRTLPSETEALIAQSNASIPQSRLAGLTAEGNLGMLPQVQQGQRDQLTVDDQERARLLSNAPEMDETARLIAGSNRNKAATTAALAAAAADDAAIADVTEAQRQAGVIARRNAETAVKDFDAAEAARIEARNNALEIQKGNIEKIAAEAADLRAQAGNVGKMTPSQIASYRNSLLETNAKIIKSPIPGLSVTLDQYIYQTFNDDGTRNLDEDERNPVAEKLIKQMQTIQADIDSLIAIPAEAPVPQNTSGQPPKARFKWEGGKWTQSTTT
jgi:hypothetical protein